MPWWPWWAVVASTSTLFQLAEKSIEEVDLKSIRFFDDLADFVVDHATKAIGRRPCDSAARLTMSTTERAFSGVSIKGGGSPFEFDVAELVEQGFADIFSGQAGTVGNIKDIACDGHGVFSLSVQDGFRIIIAKRTAGNKAGKF